MHARFTYRDPDPLAHFLQGTRWVSEATWEATHAVETKSIRTSLKHCSHCLLVFFCVLGSNHSRFLRCRISSILCMVAVILGSICFWGEECAEGPGSAPPLQRGPDAPAASLKLPPSEATNALEAGRAAGEAEEAAGWGTVGWVPETEMKPRETQGFLGIYLGESKHSRVFWVVQDFGRCVEIGMLDPPNNGCLMIEIRLLNEVNHGITQTTCKPESFKRETPKGPQLIPCPLSNNSNNYGSDSLAFPNGI